MRCLDELVQVVQNFQCVEDVWVVFEFMHLFRILFLQNLITIVGIGLVLVHKFIE